MHFKPDTERLYTEATQQILDRYDKEYTMDVKVSIMGLQNREVSERIVAVYDLPMTPEEYSTLQRETVELTMANAELRPGTLITQELMSFLFSSFPLFTDTESIYEEIVRKIAASFGKPYPMETRMKILGTTEQNSAATIVKDLQLPLTVPEYMKQYNSLCSQMLGNVNTQKG